MVRLPKSQQTSGTMNLATGPILSYNNGHYIENHVSKLKIQ